MVRDGVVVDMAGFRERGNGEGIRVVMSVVVDPNNKNGYGYYYADVGDLKEYDPLPSLLRTGFSSVIDFS